MTSMFTEDLGPVNAGKGGKNAKKGKGKAPTKGKEKQQVGPKATPAFAEDFIGIDDQNNIEDDDDLFPMNDDSDNEILEAPKQHFPVKPPPIAFQENIHDNAGQAHHEADDLDDSEDEGIEDYKMGGYHPVHVGEVLLDRYVIIQKLGWGHFSTVWLSKDFKHDTYVAVKVQKSAPHYLEAAYDEVEILQKVARNTNHPDWISSLKEYFKDESKTEFNRDDCHVVQLLNSFIYKGPYGNHFCMVFEIMGVTLLEIIKRYNYKGIPMHIARTLAKQVLIGLDYLHRMCGLIHTDIKPENVLLCLTNDEIKEIYDNGMLSRGKLYEERIRAYQQKHGIKVPEEKKTQGCKANGEGTREAYNNPENVKTEKMKKEMEDNIHKKLATLGDAATKKQKKKLKQREKKKLKKKLEKGEVQDESNQGQDDEEEEQADAHDTTRPDKNGTAGDRTQQNDQTPQLEEPPQRKDSKCGRAYSFPLFEGRGMMSDDHAYSAVDGGGQKLMEDISGDFGDNQAIRAPIQPPQTKQHPAQPKQNWRGPPLTENVRVKIVDLGNACWFHHHFTPLIQTRQYRSPETILGVHYGPSADVWSFACMIFEMITGDFLFEPRKGPNFTKSDDHLAQIIELVCKFPKKFALSGKDSRKFFDRHGNLRRIQGFHFWSLKEVLVEKYRIKEEEAQAFADFLLPMLAFYPNGRRTAKDALLKSQWLRMPKDENFKMNEKEFAEYHQRKKNYLDEDESFPNRHEPEEVENFDGEPEDNTYDENDADDADYREHMQNKMILTSKTRSVLDRSFYHGGYIGYGEGISLGEIDQGSNWQFQVLEEEPKSAGQTGGQQQTGRTANTNTAQDGEKKGGGKKRKKNKGNNPDQ